MVFSDQTIVLSLLGGVVLGIIYMVFRKISLIFARKKAVGFLLDFTIVTACFMVTFIISLPIDHGYIRLFQVLLELIGFACVQYSFGFVLKKHIKTKKIGKD